MANQHIDQEIIDQAMIKVKKEYHIPVITPAPNLWRDMDVYGILSDIAERGWVVATIDDKVGFLPHVFYQSAARTMAWIMDHYTEHIYGVFHNKVSIDMKWTVDIEVPLKYQACICCDELGCGASCTGI